MPYVDLQPVGRRVEVPLDATILEAAQLAGVELRSTCGGIGSCGTCRVRLVNGTLDWATLTEEGELTAAELAAGYRMACQATVRGDVRIEIPPESLLAVQRLQLEGRQEAITVDPVAVALDVAVAPPSLTDLRADVTRLLDAMAAPGNARPSIPPGLLRLLPEVLRAYNWHVRAILRRRPGTAPELAALLPPGLPLLGLAVDLGTTKIAAYLVDLANGAILASSGASNPQIAYGEDVIGRISYAMRGSEYEAELQRRTAECLNRLIDELCVSAAAERTQIVDAVLAGNTAMHHLAIGLPVEQLGRAPYVPAVAHALDLPAAVFGIDLAPGVCIHLPPNIAGYVGGDHVAMLLATGAWDAAETVVALDIGTNTEIALHANGRLLCCSCASGPAFEGAHIRDGMRAVPGAIDRVMLPDGLVQYTTIDQQPPIGICGSGILDAVAALRSAGLLDQRGAMRSEHPNIRRVNGRAEFLLAPAAQTAHGRDIVVTRADVHEIQLAKGAIRAGIDMLLAEAGLRADQIDSWIVAGAFGTYLDLESAVRIGMLPDQPRERFRQVGNAAGMGAVRMLVSAEQRARATIIAGHAEYIELTTHPAFAEVFVEALTFP